MNQQPSLAEKLESEREAPPPVRVQEREKRRIFRSFAYFLRHYVYVADRGGTKLEPWRWQRELAVWLPVLRRILTLKARQLGISWIAAAYAVWVILRERGALVLMISQTKDDAIELLSKAQFIFDALPEWLKPEGALSRTQLLKLPSMRSAIVALPSTRRAGRGKTARLVICDEHAQHTWAEANFAAVSPTVDAGGQFWSIATADGVGNLFADLCAQASKERPWVIPILGPNGHFSFRGALRLLRRVLHPDEWVPLFLPYNARPGRDADWWERKAKSYPRAYMVHQEYPRDPDEAFVQTGRPVFEKEIVDWHKKLCGPPLAKAEWPAEFKAFSADELRIFAKPITGHRHVAGADVAEGLEHGDYSDLRVFDFDADSGKPVEVLSLHGHWPPEVFAKLIDTVARLYPGLYGIERNNHGYTVVVKCREFGTPGLFRERPILNSQGEEIEPGKLGWLTNKTTKPLMVDGLGEALRDKGIHLRDEASISELIFYKTFEDGSTGAPAGRCDDRVIALAIMVQMIRNLPPRGGSQTVTARSSTARSRW